MESQNISPFSYLKIVGHRSTPPKVFGRVVQVDDEGRENKTRNVLGDLNLATGSLFENVHLRTEPGLGQIGEPETVPEGAYVRQGQVKNGRGIVLEKYIGNKNKGDKIAFGNAWLNRRFILQV